MRKLLGMQEVFFIVTAACVFGAVGVGVSRMGLDQPATASQPVCPKPVPTPVKPEVKEVVEEEATARPTYKVEASAHRHRGHHGKSKSSAHRHRGHHGKSKSSAHRHRGHHGKWEVGVFRCCENPDCAISLFYNRDTGDVKGFFITVDGENEDFHGWSVRGCKIYLEDQHGVDYVVKMFGGFGSGLLQLTRVPVWESHTLTFVIDLATTMGVQKYLAEKGLLR